MALRRELRGPGVFTGLYMAGSLLFLIRGANLEFAFYWLVMVVLVLAVWWLDRRIRLTTLSLWLLAVWGFMHMMGGNVPIPERYAEPGEMAVLYSFRPAPWLPKYDQVVHAFGFFTSTLVAWRAVNAAACERLPPRVGPIFAAMMVSMGLSAMNEIIEFIATLLFEETNVGGYVNTGWDLVSNFTGCVIGGLWLYVRKGDGGRAVGENEREGGSVG